VAVVHCETTTGILNPLEQIIQVAREYGKVSIVDAMRSFGFVLARKEILAGCTGIARTLSLDLYAQWEEMERYPGKWRYTSPTHVVRVPAVEEKHTTTQVANKQKMCLKREEYDIPQ
jgi:2-aminoethylphosphonate-pyruvate transaminase